MKSFIKKTICILFAVLMLVPANMCALANDEYPPEVVAEQEGDMARISGLISTYYIGISNSGTNLSIVAKITCVTGVVKCGFKEIMVQRRKSSSDSWADYFSYKEIYADRSSHNYANTVPVAKGYQYRVTCKHYAKKSLLSTQTINSTSNVVTI